jgi:hypothetical protein
VSSVKNQGSCGKKKSSFSSSSWSISLLGIVFEPIP